MGSGELKSPKGSLSGNPHKVDAPGSPKGSGDSLKVDSAFGSPKSGGDPYTPDVPAGGSPTMTPPRNTPRDPRVEKRA